MTHKRTVSFPNEITELDKNEKHFIAQLKNKKKEMYVLKCIYRKITNSEN